VPPVGFRMQRSSIGCSVADAIGGGRGAGNIIFQSLGAPWRPEFGTEWKHFVSGNNYFLFLGLLSPKRRVRADSVQEDLEKNTTLFLLSSSPVS
jgi:hypothetical protein